MSRVFYLAISILLLGSFCDEQTKAVSHSNAEVSDDFLKGKFQPSKNSRFAIIPGAYSIRKNQYLQKETIEHFVEMAKVARNEGIDIYILSPTRNFYAQKSIWERKFIQNEKEGLMPRENALKILLWSSMPGTSRHHWGTDFDIVFSRKNAQLSNRIYESGQGLRTYQWMKTHARKFGFCQPYTGLPASRDNSREGRPIKHGYQQEKWHWSYQPLASKYLKTYFMRRARMLPSGFRGDSAGNTLFLDYVMNVDKSCQ